jgi:hypothetical protein
MTAREFDLFLFGVTVVPAIINIVGIVRVLFDVEFDAVLDFLDSVRKRRGG